MTFSYSAVSLLPHLKALPDCTGFRTTQGQPPGVVFLLFSFFLCLFPSSSSSSSFSSISFSKIIQIALLVEEKLGSVNVRTFFQWAQISTSFHKILPDPWFTWTQNMRKGNTVALTANLCFWYVTTFFQPIVPFSLSHVSLLPLSSYFHSNALIKG